MSWEWNSQVELLVFVWNPWIWRLCGARTNEMMFKTIEMLLQRIEAVCKGHLLYSTFHLNSLSSRQYLAKSPPASHLKTNVPNLRDLRISFGDNIRWRLQRGMWYNISSSVPGPEVPPSLGWLILELHILYCVPSLRCYCCSQILPQAFACRHCLKWALWQVGIDPGHTCNKCILFNLWSTVFIEQVCTDDFSIMISASFMLSHNLWVRIQIAVLKVDRDVEHLTNK